MAGKPRRRSRKAPKRSLIRTELEPAVANARIASKLEYQGLVRLLNASCARRNIELSKTAKDLIRLAARDWLADPPNLREAGESYQVTRVDVALKIMETALDDDHIQRDIGRSGVATFRSLLYSMGHAGQGILSDLLEDKGFWSAPQRRGPTYDPSRDPKPTLDTDTN